MGEGERIESGGGVKVIRSCGGADASAVHTPREHAAAHDGAHEPLFCDFFRVSLLSFTFNRFRIHGV